MEGGTYPVIGNAPPALQAVSQGVRGANIILPFPRTLYPSVRLPRRSKVLAILAVPKDKGE